MPPGCRVYDLVDDQDSANDNIEDDDDAAMSELEDKDQQDLDQFDGNSSMINTSNDKQVRKRAIKSADSQSNYCTLIVDVTRKYKAAQE